MNAEQDAERIARMVHETVAPCVELMFEICAREAVEARVAADVVATAALRVRNQIVGG